MLRTTVLLPNALRAKVDQYAKQHQMTLGEVMRHALENLLASKNKPATQDNAFFADQHFLMAKSTHLALHHDDHLYGESE